MNLSEKKTEMLRQQVNSKVIWGARDREVLDWLQERHGITDAAANDFLAEAYRAKRAAVRWKALLYLAFSVPGMLAAVLFVVLQCMGNFVVVGSGAGLILFLGFISIGVFVRSLFRLLTGHTEGSVD